MELLINHFRDNDHTEDEQFIDTTIRNINISALNIEHFERSKYRSQICADFIAKNIHNVIIGNHINIENDEELLLIHHDFFKQLTVSMSILIARDIENKNNSKKSFKSEYVQATERIGELKKQLKQKNVELDELRRVKKEKKEIKLLKKELDETRIILLKKQIEELDNMNVVDAPEYSAECVDV